jgi:hypothetical protein
MKTTKQIQAIKRSMILKYFNEDYADRIEKDMEELNTIMAGLDERTVYDYTCRNNNVPSIYRVTN